MKIFSPNMLKTFQECPYKFFLKYTKKITITQSSKNAEKGKKIHALASYYLKGTDIRKFESVLTKDEKITWEKLKSNKYFNFNPLKTEYNLSCKVHKFWIGGRLDALMQEEKNQNYYILDYKTGKIPFDVQNDFQTIIYLLCADKLLQKKGGYNNLSFTYLGLKEDIEKEIILNATLKKEYEERIVSVCEKIEFAKHSNMYKKDKTSCKNCEYNKICNTEGENL